MPSHVTSRALTSTAGTAVPVPDQNRLVHLQFRRFAGCPICNLHLRSITNRHEEIRAAGITEVVVFHATEAELHEHVADLPFPVIADPDKSLYREFGVVSGPRAVLDPRVWPVIVRAVVHALRTHPVPITNPTGGRLTLPADFLIAPDGRVLAHRYGRHAGDQWSVDELLALIPAEDDTHDGTRRGVHHQ